MTKREICERLLKTRDYLAAYEKLLLKDNCPFDADDLGACADTLRDLLLDLAAPVEENAEAFRERCRAVFGNVSATGKKEPEKKEPPLLIYEENCEKVPCPVCGAPAAPIKNKPGVFLCKRCGGLVCAKEDK